MLNYARVVAGANVSRGGLECLRQVSSSKCRRCPCRTLLLQPHSQFYYFCIALCDFDPRLPRYNRASNLCAGARKLKAQAPLRVVSLRGRGADLRAQRAKRAYRLVRDVGAVASQCAQSDASGTRSPTPSSSRRGWRGATLFTGRSRDWCSLK